MPVARTTRAAEEQLAAIAEELRTARPPFPVAASAIDLARERLPHASGTELAIDLRAAAKRGRGKTWGDALERAAVICAEVP